MIRIIKWRFFLLKYEHTLQSLNKADVRKVYVISEEEGSFRTEVLAINTNIRKKNVAPSTQTMS